MQEAQRSRSKAIHTDRTTNKLIYNSVAACLLTSRSHRCVPAFNESAKRALRWMATIVGQIGVGFVVLLGVGPDDGDDEVHWLAEKIVGLRMFEDDAGKMNRSLAEVGGAMLVVSQFTLYGDCRHGRRPSFSNAAPPELAERLYEAFVAKCGRRASQSPPAAFAK